MLTTAYKPTLSCAHCVVSGYSYVYNNAASDTTNTYYTNLAAGVSTNPGFCCRKVGSAFICEEDYKIFNFLTGHASISAADVTKVRTLFANIAASNLKGGETQRDILLSALYAEIGKNITTDAAAILLKFQQTWASAVMYNMINASESSVNGIKTLAALNRLLGYLNAIQTQDTTNTTTNYKTTVEPVVITLTTTEDSATLLTRLEKIRLFAVLWAKDKTNAAAIWALLDSAVTTFSNESGTPKTNAVAAQTTERAALVAYTVSTDYSASSDAINTKLVEVQRKMWLIKNWNYTDYTAAIADFTTIAGLTYKVEKDAGTALRTTFDDLWKATYASAKKTEIQTKLYWYKQQTYGQMYTKILALKGTIIGTESTLTAAVAKLDLILADLKAQSKGVEITGLMILYAYANMVDTGDTNIVKAEVIDAIDKYDLYIKNAGLTTAGTALIAANYSSANYIVQKYAGATGADKTAKNLQMTDLASVFYWAVQMCLDSTVATAYTAELSTWKTQTGGSYLYVRDAMMLVNMKNQGTPGNPDATKKADFDKWLVLIDGNNKAGTQTLSSGSVTASAAVMRGTGLTNDFWEHYGHANVTGTTAPTMWQAVPTIQDLAVQIGNSGVTAASAQLWCHQLVFLEAAYGSTAFITAFPAATLTGYIVAGGSSYTAGGTASQLVTGDMTTATATTAIVNVYSAAKAAESTYWYKTKLSNLAQYASSGLTVSTATSVTVQAPEPTVNDAEPVVQMPPFVPHDVIAKTATGPVVGATFNNPDPAAATFFKSSDFASKWLGLMACPTKKDVCGTRDITASTSETLIKIGGTTAMKNTDQCTYIVKATGIPQISLNKVNSGSLSKYKIVYVEFDDKWKDLKMDATVKTVPDKTTKFNWVDDAFAFTEGTLGLFKLKNGTKFRFLNANYVEEIIKDFKALKSTYDTAKTTFETAAKAYDTAATAITAEIAKLVAAEVTIADAKWTALPVKPLAPAMPNAYAGVHETSTDLTKFTGYGSPTAGEISLSLDYGTYKYFGVFGQGLTNGNLGYSSVTGTSNKMILLSVYPSSADAWTQSNGTSGYENLWLGVKSTTAATPDLKDPGTVTAATGPVQVDPWKKVLDAKWAAYLNPA